MIVLFTDFGAHDPYVGQLHMRIRAEVPAVAVIDLWHAVPNFAIETGAYLLPAYSRGLPPGTIVVAVVDPGVGGSRAALWLQAGGCDYLGPDNGLFELIARDHPVSQCAHLVVPAAAAVSFHGRDVFAPAAVALAQGRVPPSVPGPLTRYPQWPADCHRILYIDHYGNAITGVRALGTPRALIIHGVPLVMARVFSDCPANTPFFYANANGLWEVAATGASAADILNLSVGDVFTFEA
ncbi:MAG: SAM hydrolase/SAM-dependent halogenase family protein [Acidiferrobacter sp.]